MRRRRSKQFFSLLCVIALCLSHSVFADEMYTEVPAGATEAAENYTESPPTEPAPAPEPPPENYDNSAEVYGGGETVPPPAEPAPEESVPVPNEEEEPVEPNVAADPEPQPLGLEYLYYEGNGISVLAYNTDESLFPDGWTLEVAKLSDLMSGYGDEDKQFIKDLLKYGVMDELFEVSHICEDKKALTPEEKEVLYDCYDGFLLDGSYYLPIVRDADGNIVTDLELQWTYLFNDEDVIDHFMDNTQSLDVFFVEDFDKDNISFDEYDVKIVDPLSFDGVAFEEDNPEYMVRFLADEDFVMFFKSDLTFVPKPIEEPQGDEPDDNDPIENPDGDGNNNENPDGNNGNDPLIEDLGGDDNGNDNIDGNINNENPDENINNENPEGNNNENPAGNNNENPDENNVNQNGDNNSNDSGQSSGNANNTPVVNNDGNNNSNAGTNNGSQPSTQESTQNPAQNVPSNDTSNESSGNENQINPDEGNSGSNAVIEDGGSETGNGTTNSGKDTSNNGTAPSSAVKPSSGTTEKSNNSNSTKSNDATKDSTTDGTPEGISVSPKTTTTSSPSSAVKPNNSVGDGNSTSETENPNASKMSGATFSGRGSGGLSSTSSGAASGSGSSSSPSNSPKQAPSLVKIYYPCPWDLQMDYSKCGEFTHGLKKLDKQARQLIDDYDKVNDVPLWLELAKSLLIPVK